MDGGVSNSDMAKQAAAILPLAKAGSAVNVMRTFADDILDNFVSSATGLPIGPSAFNSPVLFGQRRIDPMFSTKLGVPAYLSGRRIEDVAADLRLGILSPDQLPIDAFRDGSGKIITLNNRTLAALSEAKMTPTVINWTTPTRNELLRLTEKPIINSPIPGPQIPITPNRNDPTVLRTVRAPF